MEHFQIQEVLRCKILVSDLPCFLKLSVCVNSASVSNSYMNFDSSIYTVWAFSLNPSIQFDLVYNQATFLIFKSVPIYTSVV